MRTASWKTRTTALGIVVLVAVGAVACSSTNSTATATTGSSSTGGTSKIPASAFSDHTGVTPTAVDIGNVSTLSVVPGLFKGAVVGTEAYAAYVNSMGGVHGRKIVVQPADDKFSGAGNRQATQSAIENDFALVGSFSLQDSYGGALLAQNPGMPDVSVALDLKTNHLPNVFSAVPALGGWLTGPLEYFKQQFPSTVDKAATLVAGTPSSQTDWAGEKYALEKVGFKVVYDPVYPVSQTDFTQNVIQMKNLGVKILFIDQMPANYASALLKALVQQNFHPKVVLGAATYSNALVAESGGASAVNGSYLDQNYSLYLGGDARAIPAVGTFLHWVAKTSPGFQPDLFTLYGWLSAELFTQALQNAGTNPSRGSLLQALSKITSFDGNHIIAPTDPAAKKVGNCYIIGEVVNGQFVRTSANPSVSGPTHGYRCNGTYLIPPGTPGS